MARKPNWKRRKLDHFVNDSEREGYRRQQEIERRILLHPRELHEFLRKYPSMLDV